jgi:hypothetical protein
MNLAPSHVMSAAQSPPPTIHEATRIPGGVQRGAPLTEAEALSRRRAGLDIVVCGDDTIQNRDLAERIEAQVGGAYMHGNPHRRAVGPDALPHWQQRGFPPQATAGHSFYETHITKARL